MLKVIIAEDDFLMADLLEDVLVDGGYEVCGIARSADEAVELCARHNPDLAVLDVRLAGGSLGTDIPARLNRHGRPGILYATGNQGRITLANADGEACMDKPYSPDDVIRALEIVEQIVKTGMASKPFPAGFHLLPGTLGSDKIPGPADVRFATDVKRLQRQQAALAGFGSFVLHERDLDAVLTEAARVCAAGLDVPFSKVCRYRPEENDLLVEAGVGWHKGVIGHASSRADETSPQGRAFITGNPVICNDINADASLVLPSFYADHRIISTMDVVIKKEGKPYGVLEIDSPVQHDYDRHDIDFLTGFANVLAEAVDTSRRNAALRTALGRMEDMVADRDRLIAAKDRLLEEKNRLIAEKNVLAEELQHRVRNNLQLVHGMLSKQVQMTTSPAGKEGLSAIARRVMTLAEVYEHLLGAGLRRTIDLDEYLSSLCSRLSTVAAGGRRNVQLVCRCHPVTLDLDSVTALGLIVAELISNCYTHAFPDGTGTISVSLSRNKSGDEAMLTVADNGIGFDEVKNSRRHGVGLVRRLMEQVRGSAALRSDNGSEWILTFPVPALSTIDSLVPA